MQRSVAVSADDDPDARGLGVLDGVGDGLAGDVVRGGGDVVGQDTSVEPPVEPHGSPQRQGLKGGAEAVVEGAGPQAVRQFTQLRDGCAQFGHGLVEESVDVDTAVVEMALREPQRHAEADQP